MKDKTFFFLILGLACFWLVLDDFYGRGLLTKFITAIIPSAGNEIANSNTMINGNEMNMNATPVYSGTGGKRPDGLDSDFYWDGSKWTNGVEIFQ